MDYRKEIDGLRALAVLAVILFHAGFTTFSGGFVGVDVFFVISGYLISTIIIKAHSDNAFSLVTFYERRARRILPALFFILLCCLPFAWLWLPPLQMESFAKSLISVIFFASNFFFWSEAGYFDDNVDEKPLLHTWSLAVEEQFYIVFPLLLILSLRFFTRHTNLVLGAIGIASLVLAEYWSKTATASAFYLLPARAWELMAGAVIAQKESVRGRAVDSPLGGWWSLLGLSLIFLSIFVFTAGTRHPSVYTVIPIIGTMLVIRYGRSPGIARRLLTQRTVVGIGLISYSLYLWHQPVFAFARIRSLLEPTLSVKLALGLISIALAWLSWRYIERPFRQSRTGWFTRKHIFSYSGVGSLCLVGLGSVGLLNNGLQQRFDPALAPIFTAEIDKNPAQEVCLLKTLDVLFTPEFDQHCRMGALENQRVLLWGDSHADAIAWELAKLLGESDLGLAQVTKGACIPITGLVRGSCLKFNRMVRDYLANGNEDILILHGRWTKNVALAAFDNGDGGIEDADPWQTDVHNADELPGELSREERVLVRTQQAVEEYLAAGKKVILVYPVPEAGWDVPKYVMNSNLYGNETPDVYTPYGDGHAVSTRYDIFMQHNQRMLAALDAIAAHPNLYRVKPHEYLCDTYVKGRCVNSLGAKVLYRDDDHLSNTGARLIVGDIAELVKRLARQH